MAGIVNINIGNLNPNKLSSKLSFQLGEQFLAKVVKDGQDVNEVLLKLLDGWQFSANVKDNTSLSQGNLLRFQVTGFENGQLQLIVVQDKNDGDRERKDTIETLLKDVNVNVDEKDGELLKSMVKHSIPLTKENIENAKTIIDFKEKGQKGEEDNFIQKYLQSKDIDINSEVGKAATNILKGFIKEIKALSNDEIATLLENNVDLNEDNINSFIKLMKDPSLIYKIVSDVGDKISNSSDTKGNIGNNTVMQERQDGISKEIKDLIEIIASKEENTKAGISEVINKESPEILEDTNIGNKQKQIGNNDNIIKSDSKLFSKSTLEEIIGLVPEDGNNKDDVNNIIIKGVGELVKTEIDSKIDEMKNIINSLLQEKQNIKQASTDGILNNLSSHINEIKVYNSLSANYYYMAIPLNVGNKEYDLRLIIKDDRKTGKSIDSKDVKLVASVKTINMDIVDAYISVKNSNMNINLKSSEKWTSFLKAGEEDIKKILSSMGYDVKIAFSKKESNVDIVSCRDFFQDSNLGKINVVV